MNISIEDDLEPDLFHVVYVDPTGARRVITCPDELSGLGRANIVREIKERR